MLSNILKVKIITENKGWICQRLATVLANNLNYVTISMTIEPGDSIVYYLPYLWYEFFPNFKKSIPLGYFTHYLPGKHKNFYDSTARKMKHCVAVSDYHVSYLSTFINSSRITRMYVPIDPGFQPRKLKVGWYSRHYNDNRKREGWLSQLVKDTTDWAEFTSSYGNMSLELVQESMRNQDIILVTSKYEAGPLSLLEALASGIPCLIGEDVGNAPEFKNNPKVITFTTDSYESMKSKLYSLYEERLITRSSVSQYSESNWIQSHDKLFKSLV